MVGSVRSEMVGSARNAMVGSVGNAMVGSVRNAFITSYQKDESLAELKHQAPNQIIDTYQIRRRMSHTLWPIFHDRYLDSRNSAYGEKLGVGNISPRALRRRIGRYWHLLGYREIEPGKPPQGIVIYPVLYRTGTWNVHQVSTGTRHGTAAEISDPRGNRRELKNQEK